jgi:Tol biopolymer transport system component
VLLLGDLDTGDSRDLLPDGQAAVWHPDGRRIALLRQYTDGESKTQGQQVYLYDLADETLTPLIVDNAYNHGALSFSPDGASLLVQRYSLAAPLPEVWVYEMASGALTLVASNSYLPEWIPQPQ